MVARLDNSACSGFRFDHPVVLRLEKHPEHVADASVVLDDQHAEHRLGHGAGSAVGCVNTKRAPPPGRCIAEMRPPCALMIALQIAPPRTASRGSSAERDFCTPGQRYKMRPRPVARVPANATSGDARVSDINLLLNFALAREM
jgi:hypothetical protein